MPFGTDISSLAFIIGAKYFGTPWYGAVDVRVCGLGGGADVRFGHQTQHPMTPRPLFFDLDHTLWDFETNSRLALRSGFEPWAVEAHIPLLGPD